MLLLQFSKYLFKNALRVGPRFDALGVCRLGLASGRDSSQIGFWAEIIPVSGNHAAQFGVHDTRRGARFWQSV